jgi:uncharacterized HAD superfamily protein
MVKKLIGIDLDGVAADFNTEFLRLSRKLLAKPKAGYVVTNFDYSKCGWSKAEVQRIFNHIRHTSDFWTTLQRLPRTSSLAKHEKDYEYFFITSRMSTDGNPVTYQSESWLRTQYGLRSPYVIVSNEKGAEAAKLELDYFIDDRTEHAVDVATTRPNCKVYLLDTTYNQDCKDARITRVTDLNSFFKEIAHDVTKR